MVSRTYLVDHGVAIGETAGGAAVEVDAVGEVVGLGKRRQVVVVPVVDERVPEHEHRRHHLSPATPPSSATAADSWARSYVRHLLPGGQSRCYFTGQGHRQKHRTQHCHCEGSHCRGGGMEKAETDERAECCECGECREINKRCIREGKKATAV